MGGMTLIWDLKFFIREKNYSETSNFIPILAIQSKMCGGRLEGNFKQATSQVVRGR